MENAAKALEMAAGVLLAVLIMSLIAYFFTNISSWPEQQDSEKMAEQTTKFNLEYEVYDKKGMYGTDVISCLTKAKNNNEKYVIGEKFLGGSTYGETYWIDVFVNIKSDLKESVVVYHIANDALTGVNKQQIQFTNAAAGVTMSEAGFVFKETNKGNIYTLFLEGTPLDPTDGKLEKTISKDSPGIPPERQEMADKFIVITDSVATHKGKTYNTQLFEKPGDEITNSEARKEILLKDTPLKILLDTAGTNLKQVVRNTNSSTLTMWSYAEWTTALYDFKTRRFKCDDIVYSDITGRVSEIYFSEI